jgi:hypothetical protein
MAANQPGRYSGLVQAPRGTGLCQCPACFEMFSGESTFVLHRIAGARVGGEPGQYFLGYCRHPADKGMSLSDTGVWSLPRSAPGNSDCGGIEGAGTPVPSYDPTQASLHPFTPLNHCLCGMSRRASELDPGRG